MQGEETHNNDGVAVAALNKDHKKKKPKMANPYKYEDPEPGHNPTRPDDSDIDSDNKSFDSDDESLVPEDDSETGTDSDSNEGSPRYESGRMYQQYGLEIELPDYRLFDDPLPGLQEYHPFTASPGGDIFDLGVIPYDEFLRIPPNIVWCILRAQRFHQGGDLKEIDGKVMEQLLDLACMSTLSGAR